jgi:hypothetical protein
LVDVAARAKRVEAYRQRIEAGLSLFEDRRAPQPRSAWRKQLALKTAGSPEWVVP